MTQFVVDANVAIKWVLTEPDSSIALRLRRIDYTLLVPDFFFPEVTNILWKYVRRREITGKEAQQKLEALQSLSLVICPSFPLMPIALETAIAVDQAVYDCVYLTLAVVNQCQMVTADQRFYNALSNDRLFSHLLWIENLP